MIINCYVDEDTLRQLRIASAETGRTVEELAEATITNAAIEFKVSHLGYGRDHQQLKQEG